MHEQTYLITKLFGTDITLNIPSAIGTILTCLITFFMVMFFTKRVELRPDSKRQNMIEIIADLIRKVISENISWAKYGKNLWAMGLSLVTLLVVANTIGVLLEISYDDVLYINSVTADPTFTFTLAGIMILFTHYYSYKNKGAKFYLGTFASNGVWLTPFKIIEEFVNILTLSMRLFGNIFAGEVLLGMLVSLATIGGVLYFIPGIIGLVIWKGFSLFIGFIQAYIFTTMVYTYISHKVSDEH
ncbi:MULTISPECIES: F0F1 ATP synthase subunit A [unclassified Gemella]|uniref:F0F1 ATP synthase subunit A n=1 Tax=unclassified Gemella TaxID=2624949 RepID=UPI001C0468ED|nr:MULTISPECIES: F0F1 ATP synthase subunit A [unclassified Gemella]MBU0278425.1 F0F1 ATP synthase subunit A [Gemella sp. zg-1178]QWQ38963.1 F0F1 ATP synthase subunit A [Gemella sp. zg-570]